MTLHQVTDLKTPIGEILQNVGSEGVLLKSRGAERYALIPLDDETLDFLLERNQKFAEECRRIRQRMRAGQFHRHEEVRRMFASTSIRTAGAKKKRRRSTRPKRGSR